MPLNTCPCCGYKTLKLEPGSWDICTICFWEDDPSQLAEPDFEGGANNVSLRTAQQNFMKYGANEEGDVKFARKPNPTDKKDDNWKPLPPKPDGD